jgi:GT2 family glycosyltransferase
LQRVDAVGTGCFLVSRRVFLDERMQKGAFQRTFNEDGTVDKGNDLAFCERARACGFEIWAHYGYPCMHFNSLELNEVALAFKRLYE